MTNKIKELWHQLDKWQHFIGGLTIAQITALLWTPLAGLLVGVWIGETKEIRDRYGKTGHCDLL